MTLDRPILVTGTPRSGKSVVAKRIGRAPEFHHLSEPLMIWDAQIGRRDDDRREASEATDAVREQIVSACRAAVAGSGRRRYVDDLAYHALRIPFVHAHGVPIEAGFFGLLHRVDAFLDGPGRAQLCSRQRAGIAGCPRGWEACCSTSLPGRSRTRRTAQA